ncbi:sporulation protein YqfD [Bacillus salitolerans]|uniref:Sporulation protein YqfD n=1 Tax=Bacillus salitolerans TaxID=1437434 RepID=A0ABW4LNB4_9BACI
MKNQWTNFFSGHVKIKIYGKGIERFINECVRQNIMIWEVNKQKDSSVTCSLHLSDVHKLRRIVRKNDCKLKFLKGGGVPFLIRRAFYNSGFMIGTVFCIFILFILSNMVWGIEIEGAKPETEHIIRKELQAMGIKAGTFQFLVEDVESVQKHLSEKIQNITWVGVELNGTTYHFQVVEKNQPKETEYFSPRHLVAKKKAIITNMFVEEGQPLVAINDYVKEGDLLVSGFIGKEGQTKVVSARGEIMGETWYEAHVSVPLKTTFRVLTGSSKTTHYIRFFHFDLPVWGFGKHKFSEYQTDLEYKSFRFLKWDVPIGYKKKVVLESEQVERVYSEEEAIKTAMANGRKEIKQRLDEHAMIKGEKVLRQSINNGKVNLSIHYQVLEEISVGQPIIQGD